MLFEMRIRLGGDPRGFGEFVALREELAKLSHPACPDVDWAKVEQWCLTLFEQNGADLQTAVAFALARSQRNGLEGMVQGVALIETLCCQWSACWPPMASVRLDILTWLFVQWQSLLRNRALGAQNFPTLLQLDTELARLQQRLEQQLQPPLVALHALRQQIESLVQRTQRSSVSLGTLSLPPREPASALLMPMVILPANPMPEMQPAKRRVARWLCAAAAMLGLASGAWWLGTTGAVEQRFTQLFEPAPTFVGPVRLDSLSLFDAGSAELKPGSTKILIRALVDIKAQPGWLIVIGGHTDGRGNPQQNFQLSHARASAVRDWMQRMGDIPDSCFAVQGFAASQPVTSNDSESGRAANRRVEISLLPQAGACEQETLGARPA
ncbi:flagellar motor protein MotB [Pseudomonas sp. FW215-T2]|nr:flagellar motor protein MotB [Pseudomonas sp. FW215-T2]PNA08379.1 flagellar motor protein MotB [Pseudomonas sp. FW215-R3]PNB34623.1 flagellar motor protein MotB [Pseudomonas sp. FW305-131]